MDWNMSTQGNELEKVLFLVLREVQSTFPKQWPSLLIYIDNKLFPSIAFFLKHFVDDGSVDTEG